MIQNEPNAMKEIHTIRVENFQRTKDLSPDDRSRLRTESVMPIVKRYGFRVIQRKNNEPYKSTKRIL